MYTKIYNFKEILKMLKQLFCGLSAAVLLFALAGCKSTTPQEDLTPVNEGTIPAAMDDPNFNSVPGDGFNTAQGRGWGDPAKVAQHSDVDPDGWQLADPSGNRLNMPVIYFAYDSDVLVPSETANLDKIAAYMSDKARLGLVIEGHCDSRGTDEYNRALGERRANAIRQYLIGRGIADKRIKTKSFGKDNPAVPGEGESIWRQNRRGVPVPMLIPVNR